MSDEYEDGGSLPLGPDGTLPIPGEFDKPRTVRSWSRTVVQYEDSEREYDSPNPELREEREDAPDVFYLTVSEHGEDREVRFRVRPVVEGDEDEADGE